MLQHLTITTEETVRLKPLIEIAIQNETKLLAHGIQRTRDKLRLFEQRFGFASEDFERRFAAGEFKETLDFIEWSGEIKLLHILESQQRVLAGAQIVD
ncbi:MAG TPA: hypothetical protein VII92_16070 [Anaerolineae bacterium]